MKNLSKTIVTAAFALFISGPVSAAIPVVELKECKNNTCENFAVGMYRVRDTETMNLLVRKQKGQKLAIKLTDYNGKVLHEEFVGRNIEKFGKKLNFSELEDGTYTLVISNESEKVVKTIFLGTNEVREVNRLLVGAN